MIKKAVKRRDFLGLGTTILGGLFLPVSKQHANPNSTNWEVNAANNLTAFVTESGLYAKGGLFLMGLMTTLDQAAKHESQLQKLRKDFNYRTRLTYKDADRFKLDFAKACIDYFVNTEELGYIALYREQQSPRDLAALNISNISNLQIREKKIELIKDLIVRSQLDIKTIKMKSQSPYGPSAKFKEKFNGETGFTLDARDTRFGDDLLQLGDFIGGCIYGDITQKTRNRTKLALTQYLKEKLGVSSFNQPSLEIEGKLKITKII